MSLILFSFYFLLIAHKLIRLRECVLWQLLVTKTNDCTSSKSLNMDIKWEVHKRTQQEVSAKLESYIYKTCLVCATNN